MRIDEIGVPKGLHNAAHILMRAGYKVLGRPGAWGKVFQKPGSPYVLKLFANEDEAYTAYAALCRSHQGNPYLPKIIGKVVRVTDHYSAVRLEPLAEPPDWSDRVEFLVARCSLYIKTVNYDPPDASSPYAMLISDARDFVESDPARKEACDLIASLLPRFELDLSIYNVMMRGKQYVFTDPVKIDQSSRRR